MKWPWDRGGLRTYLLVVALVFGRPEQMATVWGLPLLLAGLVLQVYAKGCLQQDQVVAQGGAYRFVRHPFYAANLLVDEGIAVMSGWIPLMLALPVWWLAVYLPVMRREERDLGRLFPESYPAYRKQVSMLIPLHSPLRKTEVGFSWRNPNIVSDTVLPRALRTASLPLLFLLSRPLRAHGLHLFQEPSGIMSLSVAILVSAYGLSWELARHLKYRRRVLPPAAAGLCFRLAAAAVVLAAAGSLHVWEVESNRVMPLVGLVIVAASVVLYFGAGFSPAARGAARLAAEGMALTAAVVLCEVLWLTPLPILLHGALVLDSRTASPAAAPPPRERPAFLRLLHGSAYAVILVGGLAVALAKELLT
jgi:hypothetical protein